MVLGKMSNLSVKKTRKAVNFDLDTLKLREKFLDTRKPYNDIKKFMESNGFERRQYSGYVSINPISESKIILLMKKMRKKNTWLKDCIQKFDVTEIGNTFDLKYIFDNNIKNKE